MAYCTIDDLKKMLPEAVLIRLTDDSNTGAIVTARAQEAIDSAAEEIDVYLGSRIALPITGTVPPVLGKSNVDLAIYNLFSRVKETVPETREKRYRNAIRLLEKVSEGKISLGIQPPPDAPADEEYFGRSRVDARDKDFDETTMGKY